MRFLTSFLIWLHLTSGAALGSSQIPLIHQHDRAVSPRLFGELEELARIVDISYCVGLTNTGISKPFTCLSRCADFPQFELIKVHSAFSLLLFILHSNPIPSHGTLVP